MSTHHRDDPAGRTPPATGELRELATTEGLTPTYPAFSPDGRRIAFRNWTLGDLWTVDVTTGATIRYDLRVGEAAIAW